MDWRAKTSTSLQSYRIRTKEMFGAVARGGRRLAQASSSAATGVIGRSVRTTKNTWLAPLTKLAQGVKERGWDGVLMQLYTIGDLKFGELKGTDEYGNKYYENLDLPYGQHRWVEYANVHNPDASAITPAWHGWMHHTYDETPDELDKIEKQTLPTTEVTHAIYATHVGKIEPVEGKGQVNVSTYRQRGWKVGSLSTGPEDDDQYYKQPGHPLSKEEGRFEKRKEMSEWTP